MMNSSVAWLLAVFIAFAEVDSRVVAAMVTFSFSANLGIVNSVKSLTAWRITY